MKIPVRSTIDKFFKQIVDLLSNFHPIKSLNKGNKEVLAELLYQNYRFRFNKENERMILIFSKEIREEMGKRLGMSDSLLFYHFSTLRKKGILSKDNKLPKFLSYILPKKRFEFVIDFNLMEEE
jgi:hypothetical protein